MHRADPTLIEYAYAVFITLVMWYTISNASLWVFLKKLPTPMETTRTAIPPIVAFLTFMALTMY